MLSHQPQPGRYGLATFAAHGETALSHVLPAPPRRELAEFGPLPHAMPLVAQLGEEIPYVRVVVGHTGADVTVAGQGRLMRTESLQGSGIFPIRKIKAGGWSQRHWQQAAYETWRRNAAEVATAVAELAGRSDAEVIVVEGDARSVRCSSSICRNAGGSSWSPATPASTRPGPNRRRWTT